MSKKSIHIPIEENVLRDLKTSAQEEQITVSQIVNEAIENWLKKKKREKIQNQIKEYASQMAGTSQDLDEELEYNSTKFLLEDSE